MTLGDLFKPVDRDAYEDPAMPEYPGLFLCTHVTLMSEHVFTFLGTLSAVGVHGVQQLRGKATVPFAERLLLYSRNGVIGGAAIGVLMLLGKSRSDDMGPEGIADRAYRIKANSVYAATQSTSFDRVNSVGGAIVGALAAPALGVRLRTFGVPTKIIGGAGLGALTGLATFIVQQKQKGSKD